ncbi:MAG: NAD-dependent epimerase/dehydratase family protein [Gammaproteobacteria bacterium]
MSAGHVAVAALRGKRILVTGATGFIGQHLVRRLLATEARHIRVLARSKPRVKQVFGPGDRVRLEVVAGDLGLRGDLEPLCEEIDVIFHAAGLVPDRPGVTHAAPLFTRVNVEGTVRLAQAAARSGVARFVHVSSTAAMGMQTERVVDEATACCPLSPYERSKRKAELRLLELSQAGRLEVVVLRPSLVSGEGQRGGRLLKLFKLCRRGWFPIIGKHLDVEKPLLGVHDLVQALILAVAQGRPGEIYLLHSEGHHTLRQIVETAGRIVGNDRPYRHIPFPLAYLAVGAVAPLAFLAGRTPPVTAPQVSQFFFDRRIDTTKARTELGFRPRQQSLDDMLGGTYEYYLRSGQLGDRD